MSYTQVPSNLNVTVWGKQAWRETVYQSALGHFLNSGAVFRPKEFSGKDTKGQTLIYTYVRKLLQPGLGEGSVLDGNEEALNIGDFQMRVGMTRLGVLNPNDDDTLEATRTYFDFEGTTKPLIVQSAVEKLDWSIFNQLAGNNATSMTLGGIPYTNSTDLLNVTGQNTIIAPSSDRIIRPGNVANDQSLTSSNKMSLPMIDYAIELLANSSQQIGYLNDGFLGELWISYEQFTDLKIDTTSPIQWYSNALADAAGGDRSDLIGKGYYKNRILPKGEYGGVKIYVHPRVSYGVNSSNSASITTVRRAVLVGRDALSYASRMGRGLSTDSEVPLAFKIQMKDYDYWKGIEGRLIYGIHKNTPSNGSDIGVVVISTYAASHTS